MRHNPQLQTRPLVPARRLSFWLNGPLLKPVRKVAAAIIVSAGPWIVSVMALAVVSVTMQPLMGMAAVEDLRLTVVYAFAIAPLVAGPIGSVAARLVRQTCELERAALTPEIFLVAALASSALSAALATAVALALKLQSMEIALAFVFLTAAAALLWTCFAVLSALREYNFLIGAFSAGMALSVACTLVTTRAEPTAEYLIWSFTTGIVFCVTLAFTRAAINQRLVADKLSTAFWLIVGEISRVWPLCLGIAFAVAGVWIDKWTFWFASAGMRSSAGFRHFGTYDAVMFIAHLSMVPTFAAMLMLQDGPLHTATRLFRSSLCEQRNYDEVRDAARAVEHVVWMNIFQNLFVQGAFSAGLILMAPLVASGMDFNFRQFDLLRSGVLAVFLQCIFYLSCNVLMICGRTKLFLLVQILFLGTGLMTSLLCMYLFGLSAYAVFFTSLLLAPVSFMCAYRSLANYLYLVLIAENADLYQNTFCSEPAQHTHWRLRALTARARAEWMQPTGV